MNAALTVGGGTPALAVPQNESRWCPAHLETFSHAGVRSSCEVIALITREAWTTDRGPSSFGLPLQLEASILLDELRPIPHHSHGLRLAENTEAPPGSTQRNEAHQYDDAVQMLLSSCSPLR
jgi:hypothetical protein